LHALVERKYEKYFRKSIAAIRIGRAAAILAVWLLVVSDQLSANSSGALPNLRHFYVANVVQMTMIEGKCRQCQDSQ